MLIYACMLEGVSAAAIPVDHFSKIRSPGTAKLHQPQLQL